MISKKEDKIRGKKAANKGIANEHIALGILMHKYNASKIDLPSSRFDIIIEKKIHDYIRIQSKATKSSIGFIGNMRGGKSIGGGSLKKYSYRYDTKSCDVVMGVKSTIDSSGILKEADLYFMPTILIEKLKQKSISYKKIEIFKNNYEVLENSKDKKYLNQFEELINKLNNK